MNGCQGELWEFPIINNGVFSTNGNWARGKERVIFDNCGQLCAVITHTGARGNSFRNCLYR